MAKITSIKDLSEIFIEAEKQGNLFDFKYSEIPLWWFVREKFFYALFKKLSQINLNSSTAESLNLEEILLKIIDSVHFNSYIKDDVLAVSTSSARRDKKDGRDFDVIFDFLSYTKFRDRYAIIETPDNRSHSKNPFTQRRYYGDYLLIYGNIYRQLSKVLAKFYIPHEIIYFCKSANEVFKNFGFNLDIEQSYYIFFKEYLFARASVNIAFNYIKKINPKLIITECGYSPSRMVIQMAAKRMGIPLVELQHGHIVQDGIEYFYGINSEQQIEDAPLPDIIAVYGQFYKNILLKSDYYGKKRIEIIGCPYMWLKRRAYETEQKKRRGNGKILITSQPGLTEFYIKLAVDLAKKIDQNIIIKMHPNEKISQKIINQKELLYNEKIKLLNSNISVYEIFNEVDFHISVNSTAHLEALCFGINDIIFSINGFVDQYKFLAEMGVPVVRDINELLGVIRTYPNIDNVLHYVQREIYSLDKNPISETERLIEKVILVHKGDIL